MKSIELGQVSCALGFRSVMIAAIAALATSGGTAAERGGVASPANSIATILETKLVVKEPGRVLGDGTEYGVNHNGHVIITKKVTEADRYLGWGTLAKTREGELILAYSGDRDAHVCPWGKTHIVRSSDSGRTWTPPLAITNTPLDDRDAGLIQTKSGALLVSWFTSIAFASPTYATAHARYARHAEEVTPEIRAQWLGNWVRRSEDGGRTWQTPVRTVSTAPHGPIQLRDGRLLYVGIGKADGASAVTVEQSADDGRTWNVIATIPKPATGMAGLSEPHVVELTSGKLLAMIRNEPKDRTQCFLLQSESTDGGKTWSPPRSTGIWGYPPHLIQLKNGWVVVSYGYRREPFGERACVSRDEGSTWDLANEIVLHGAPSPDLGYPSTVQLDDGSLLTTYYQAEKVGQPTSFYSTHWRLR
jgi:sialidase-1